MVEEVDRALRMIEIIDSGDERQVNQQQKKATLYIHTGQLTAFPQRIPFLRV